MKKQSPGIKNALIFCIGAAVILLGICIGGSSLLRSREATRQQLIAELKLLPVFDRDAEMRRLCEANKITPAALERKCEPLTELAAPIETQLQQEVIKAFPAAVLEAKITRIREEVGVYDGKIVEVKYYNSMGGVETIKGAYQVGSTNHVVFISGKSIKMENILPESVEQFKTTEGKRNKMIAALKKDYESAKEDFIVKHRPEITRAVHTAAGYILTSKNEWRVPSEFITSELELRKQKIEAERKEKTAALLKKYKAWGIASFNLKISNPEK